MPYATNDELPLSVRSHLPPRAQDIFREAFSRTVPRYGDAPAFRIAWAAVKLRLEKIDGVRVTRRRA
jgi:cation transport regulator